MLKYINHENQVSYLALLNTSAEIGLRPESSANMIAVTNVENIMRERTAKGTIETEEAEDARLSQHLRILSDDNFILK